MSRIGKNPVPVPTGVTASVDGQTVKVKGPKGALQFVLPDEIGAKMDLFDHLARLNLAAYLMNRTGTQIDFDNVDTTPGSPTLNLHTEETRNAPGKSKIKGIEAASSKLICSGMGIAPLAGKRTNVANVAHEAVMTRSPGLKSVTADPTRVMTPEASTHSLSSARFPSATRTSLKLRPTALTSISTQSWGKGW